MGNLNKSPEDYREYVLKQLVAAAGSWKKTGCKDVMIEKQFNSWLNQLHPTRETAMAILQQYVGCEVAA